MEKFTPHARLAVVHALLETGRVRATGSALQGANLLLVGLPEMLAVIRELTVSDFHKSMTTRGDHRVWQDVYLPDTRFGRLYVKLTVSEVVHIVSFKEA